MKTKKLSVKLKGPKSADGDVFLTDLAELCNSLTQCLKRVEAKFDGIPRLSYRIVGLRRGSAGLTVIGTSSNPAITVDNEQVGKVLGLFSDTVKRCQQGKKPDKRINGEDLRAFSQLGKVFNSDGYIMYVDRTRLDDVYIKTINDLLEKPVISFGSVSGRLERVNRHNTNEFTLYPIIGDSIRCTFTDELIHKVCTAVEEKRHATVKGKIYRLPGRSFPESIDVAEIEMHAPNSELPRLSDMLGAFKKDRRDMELSV